MAEFVTLCISQGVLRGKKATTRSGATYFSFQGIPYAQPPIGSLRFKAPQSPNSWDGVRDALSEGSVAPHIDDFLHRGYLGDEDCLFLNVYTPEISPVNALPVMVWIHGGGFYLGSGNSDIYGPDHLISEDVILVTINYRLGALGFLSTGDSVIAGNNGLKDQVMALRWVQQNIQKFGGNPDNVTIFGESAGGASVHLQLLSPLSSDLFHRAIAQSGSALNPWAFDDPSLARKKAFRFGEALGCKTTDSKTLLQFLEQVPAKVLVENVEKTLTNEEKHPLHLYFAPTRDYSENGDVFLPDSPLNIITEEKFHKQPFITGINSNEGMFILEDVHRNSTWYENLNTNYTLPHPHKLKIENNTDTYREIADEVKRFYFGNKLLTMDTRQEFADLYSDLWFINGISRSVKLLASNSSAPVYFYHFAFDGNLGFADYLLKCNRLPGASHGDELGYLFQTVTNKEKNFDPEDRNIKMLSKMTRMWTNFAKYGNPTPDRDSLGIVWSPVSNAELHYLNIDTELTMKIGLPVPERTNFWEKICEKTESLS